MKLFVEKLLILLVSELLIVFLILALFLQVAPIYEDAYTAALVDKVNRLESISEPKIVLIGNSNLSFGIDSKMIEDALKMPVVNMGLHGGLGNAFHEEMAKININTGDIIIISHTDFFDDNRIGNTRLAVATLENHKNLWQLVRKDDVIDIIKAFPEYLRYGVVRCIKKQVDEAPYSRESFNEYGDIILLKSENKIIPRKISKPPSINSTCTDRINELNELVLSQNAHLLVAAYPIFVEYRQDVNEDEFNEFQRNLENSLNCHVISRYTDYFLDSSLFYDTMYHLTTEGANIRTRLLISDIQKWQQNREE